MRTLRGESLENDGIYMSLRIRISKELFCFLYEGRTVELRKNKKKDLLL